MPRQIEKRKPKDQQRRLNKIQQAVVFGYDKNNNTVYHYRDRLFTELLIGSFMNDIIHTHYIIDGQSFKSLELLIKAIDLNIV